MTKEEFEEALKELIKKQTETYSAYLDAKRAVINCKKTYAYDIAKHFEDKIGKKLSFIIKTTSVKKLVQSRAF